MTFFTSPNRDAQSITPDSVATGPLVGFFESFQVAMDAQMRTSSQYGIEYFMHELDWQQTQSMLEAGIENPPQLMLSLEGRERGEANALTDLSVAQLLRNDSGYYEDFVPSRSGEYLDVARAYSGEGASPELTARMQEYDRQIAELRKQNPGLSLRTSQEMFGEVKRKAQDVDKREQTDRRSWGGAFGGFFGGALASMHAGTDPLNFYSLGIGGAGKSAVQRILMQTGAQGAVETVNQVTGVQEEREILGLSHGFADAAKRVGATALGGGALQGAGEVVGAGLKRWFRNVPNDPAPDPLVLTQSQRVQEPLLLTSAQRVKEEAQAALIEQNPNNVLNGLADTTPLSGIRSGTSRSIADIQDVGRQLEAWDGAAPSDLRPTRTETATYVDGQQRTAPVDTTAALENNRLYQMARDEDPRTFERYDRLLERKNTYKRWLDELSKGRDEDISATMDNIDTRIDALEARLRSAQGKGNKAKIREQIREAKADRESLIKLSERKETPDVVEVRKQMMKQDERMRDLAPLIGRAYSRARGRWGTEVTELDAVWDAYRKGRADVDMPPQETKFDYDSAVTLTDRAPILEGANRVEPAPTSAETASRVVEDNQKVIDEALEAYRAEVKSLVDSTDEGTIRIDGNEYEFDLDKDTMFMPNEDGVGGKEVTLREYLSEVKRAEDELEAVSICSVR